MFATQLSVQCKTAAPATTTQARERPAVGVPNKIWQALALGPGTVQAGRSDDPHEREADEVAHQVMRMSEPHFETEPMLQRACACGGECPNCQSAATGRVQAKFITGNASGSQLDSAHVVPNLDSSGQPLDGATKAFFEPRFGHDFSQVRVHDGSASAVSARAVSAHAYTVGPHIVFGEGRFDPNRTDGRRLLAHELTHVIQQGHAPHGSRRRGASHEVQRVTRTEPSVRVAHGTGVAAVQRDADPTASTLTPEEVDRMSNATLDENIDLAERWLQSKPVVAIEWTVVARNLDLMKKVRDGRNNKSVAESLAPTVWQEGEKVDRLGLVQVDKGTVLCKMADNNTAFKTLPLNTRVAVDRRVKGGWYFVVLDNGDYGYTAESDINTTLPDPGARLYRVQPGEGAQAIVKKFFADFKWGQDERFYVNVLVYVNNASGRKGVSKPSLDAKWDTTVTHAGSQIWIPGEDYATSLKGRVSSGSFTYEAWQTIKDVASDIAEFLLGSAAFIVGLLHGALESLWDLLVGLVDLVEMVWKVLKSIIQGELISDIKALWGQLSNLKLSDILDSVAEWLDKKWNADGIWERWQFRGWLIGYIIMEVLMLIFSDGIITAVKWVGKSAKLAKLFEKLPVLAKLAKRVEAVKDAKLIQKIKEGIAAKPARAVEAGAEALAAARRWAMTVLKIPAEIITDLSLEAIERLKRLPEWAMERFSDLNAAAMRLILGCTSPCKVKLDEIIEYLKNLSKATKVGKALTKPAEVLAALPQGLNTAKIAEYLAKHPGLMAAIKEAEMTADDFGKLSAFLTRADKTNPEIAYRTFTRYLSYAVPAKTGGDIKKFNRIAQLMMEAAEDTSVVRPLKGSMFEAFVRAHVSEFAGKVFKRARFKPGGGLELAREVRTSDFFLETAGEIWDFKHSVKVDEIQAGDYLKILNHSEPGLPR